MLGSITMYSAIWWDNLLATLSKNENEWKKPEPVPIPLPSGASSLTNPNRMDRPRGLKYLLEYVIVHLSICSFMSQGSFTSRIRLKLGLF